MDDYKEGFALYFILILLTASSIFVMTLYSGAYVNIKLSNNLTYQKKAFYAAEAGVINSKIILEENKGVPLEKENGNPYITGDIYQKKGIYGNSKFKIKFVLVEEDPKRYIVEVQGIYKQNICRIDVGYNEQFQLEKYKIIEERSL